jgi:hypothetical protein
LGIVSAALSPTNETVIIGCGDGTIAALKLPKMNIVKYEFID